MISTIRCGRRGPVWTLYRLIVAISLAILLVRGDENVHAIVAFNHSPGCTHGDQDWRNADSCFEQRARVSYARPSGYRTRPYIVVDTNDGARHMLWGFYYQPGQITHFKVWRDSITDVQVSGGWERTEENPVRSGWATMLVAPIWIFATLLLSYFPAHFIGKLIGRLLRIRS